ncbi:MAG: MATE family efflux transporter [Oscillospiraceae bacterium]|nr:MATE family efflux transporter [Oscillospiraceae bacterium]
MLSSLEPQFAKTMLGVGIPVVGSSLLQNSIMLADMLMVTTLGDQAVAAVAAANNFFFVFFLMQFGLVSGAAVLSSQYWGRRDTRSVAQIAGIMLRFSMLAGAIFAFAAIVFPRPIISAFSSDPEVVALGITYLRITGFGMLPFSFARAYWLFLRSVEKAKLGFYMQGMNFVVNVGLSATLVFGLFGLPAMGVRGAAYAVLISRVVECLVMLVYVRREKTIELRLRDITHSRGVLLRDFYKHSSVVVATEIAFGLGFSLQSVIFGQISAAALTAQSLTRLFSSLCSILTYGLTNSTAVVTGKAVGRGDFAQTKRQSKFILMLSVVIGMLCSGQMLLTRVLVLGPVYISGFMGISTQALQLLRQFMLVEAATLLFVAPHVTIIIGLLRGGGDTRFSSVYGGIFVWIYSLPAAAIGVFMFGISPVTAFMLLRFEEVIKCAVGVARVLSWKWMKNVTRNSKIGDENE